MTTTTDAPFSIVPVRNENGEIVRHCQIFYIINSTPYAFRETEHEITIIDRDGAPLEDIRQHLEEEYTDNGVSGSIISLKDENGDNF
jgi:hypothetical protein